MLEWLYSGKQRVRHRGLNSMHDQYAVCFELKFTMASVRDTVLQLRNEQAVA